MQTIPCSFIKLIRQDSTQWRALITKGTEENAYCTSAVRMIDFERGVLLTQNTLYTFEPAPCGASAPLTPRQAAAEHALRAVELEREAVKNCTSLANPLYRKLMSEAQVELAQAEEYVEGEQKV